MLLLLPAPPSLNDYYTVQKRGKFSAKVVSRVGVKYQNTLMQYKTLLGIPTYRGDLRVTIDCFPYSRNSRDVDNYLKALFDSMQYAGIVENDNLIRWELGRMQSPFRPWPCVIVDIQPFRFEPMTLEERIAEILADDGNLIGLSLAPKDVREAVEANKARLF